jgi:hypothetical protein
MLYPCSFLCCSSRMKSQFPPLAPRVQISQNPHLSPSLSRSGLSTEGGVSTRAFCTRSRLLQVTWVRAQVTSPSLKSCSSFTTPGVIKPQHIFHILPGACWLRDVCKMFKWLHLGLHKIFLVLHLDPTTWNIHYLALDRKISRCLYCYHALIKFITSGLWEGLWTKPPSFAAVVGSFTLQKQDKGQEKGQLY